MDLAATPKSKGHISFTRSKTRLLELYKIDDCVYHAHVDAPVMPDGYRAGSFLCLEDRLDSFLESYGLNLLPEAPIEKIDIPEVTS